MGTNWWPGQAPDIDTAGLPWHQPSFTPLPAVLTLLLILGSHMTHPLCPRPLSLRVLLHPTMLQLTSHLPHGCRMMWADGFLISGNLSPYRYVEVQLWSHLGLFFLVSCSSSSALRIRRLNILLLKLISFIISHKSYIISNFRQRELECSVILIMSRFWL